MADFISNIAKGKIKYYAELSGGANDAFLVVLIETTGLETDATLKDYDDLSTLIAGTSNEQTNQARKVISSVTITVDDTNDRVDIDVADQTYTALAGNAISAALFCYDPDTTTGTDTTVSPLSKHDFVITPDSSDVNMVIAAAGLQRAA
jgi:hypothetical protein